VVDVYLDGPITKESRLYNREEMLLQQLRGKTLDVGCSGGRLLIKATILGHDIIGIDRDIIKVREVKERARISGIDVNVICASSEDMPFPKERFDTIVLGEVIEHTLEPDKLIIRMMKYLKSDGTLLITTPAGLAHFDSDHKSFFFSENAFDLFTKYWITEFFPFLWANMHSLIIMERMLNSIDCFYTLEEMTYGDSEHPSLDFFITITKKVNV